MMEQRWSWRACFLAFAVYVIAAALGWTLVAFLIARWWMA